MASKYDGAEVQVINWKDYNPRVDSKRPSWFRVEIDTVLGDKFFGLNCEFKWLWMIILAKTMKGWGKPFQWKSDYIEAITGIIPASQDKILDQLVILGSISLDIKDIIMIDQVSRTTSPARARPRSPARPDKIRLEEIRLEEIRFKSSDGVPPTAASWNSYFEAYQKRYGTAPIRNATVNAQLSQLVKRLGAEAAPRVVEFYVRHNDAFYVRSAHPVGLLLKDAEGLHTQWQRGQTIVGSQARQVEQRQHTADSFDQAEAYFKRKAAEAAK